MTTQNKIQITFSDDELADARAAFGAYVIRGGEETTINKYLKTLIMEGIRKME